MQRTVVLAVGGNSLVLDKEHQTVKDQYAACVETCKHIAQMLKSGCRLAITHGNGPQVGFILRRCELAKSELHMVPLDSCGADTQGAIGYNLQMALSNELNRIGLNQPVATVVTQVVVDPDDPAFQNPTKPIGSFMDEELAMTRRETYGWDVVEDAGRGYRRVVPSPIPREIVEFVAIQKLLEAGLVAVAVGGGGIPVVRDEQGNLSGVEAVIDKDFASSLLARNLNVDLFIISTAVEKVYLDFGKASQRALDRITTAEAERYMEEGHFAPGSMRPKIQAVVEFIRATGNSGIITDPPNLERALAGETGTWIVP